MLLSLNFLKKYINLPKTVTPEQLAFDLTTKVVEVEEVIDKGKELDNIVVGKIKKISKHPNADKLKLVEVANKHELGTNGANIKVVCGGTNLKEGMLVAFAKVGVMIRWHGEGDLVKLEKAKIRGEESFGMICAANEIGLYNMFPHEEMEILDLTKFNLPVGATLAVALGLNDIIFNIDNKSITNRPDLWSHYGIARELAAIYDLKLKELELVDSKEIEKQKNKEIKKLNIEIEDKNLCSAYLGCIVESIKIKESPEWLKKQLLSLGAKPINNIVDITNYVMLEVGQPLHAFDTKTQKHKNTKTQIIIRRARKGERIITLDEEDRKLDEDMLVISDSKKPIALAGIMGGLDSGVNNKTTSIILESATFDPVNIRKTSQKLGLRTEASMRFEKSLHPELAEVGMKRVLKLITEIIPEARITESTHQQLTQSSGQAESTETLDVPLEFIQKRIGAKISEKEIINILTKLGFMVETQRNASDHQTQYRVQSPWWRNTGDVSIPEDIVEEVARIYGYNKIKSVLPNITVQPFEDEPEKQVIDKIKNLLVNGCGMTEVYNYSFLNSRIGTNINTNSTNDLIYLENPLSEEQEILRPNLIFGLLKNAKDNSRFYERFKLFEIGRVFLDEQGEFNLSKNSKKKLPNQPYHVGGVVVSGKKDELFLKAKGIVEKIILPRGCEGQVASFEERSDVEFLNSEKSIKIILNKKEIGWIGEINDEVLKNFGIKNRKIVGFEINIVGAYRDTPVQKFISLPKYPSITRDLAIVVDYKIKWQEILKIVGAGLAPAQSAKSIVTTAKENIIKQIEFLSVYDLKNGKKSIAFRIVYQSDERTLKDNEVVEIEKNILDKLAEKVGAELRK